MAQRILIVDDVADIADMLSSYFRRQGYETMTAYDGAGALRLAARQPDMILLDVNLPDMDGFAVCRALREHLDCPVLFLTARVEDADKLSGFASGGDDYVLKPFSIDELGARVAAHLRREKRHAAAAELRFDGDLVINYSDRTASLAGRDVGLARREFDILEFLSQNPGLVFDKERIYEGVWGIDGEGDSTVVVEHIRRIRVKLAAAGAQRTYIETVWGVGYKWAK